MTRWLSVVAGLSLLLTACFDEDGDKGPEAAVEGSGVAAGEVRSVTAFSGVLLQGAFQVSLEAVGQPAAKVELHMTGDDNILPMVATEVNAGILEARTTDPVAPELPLTLAATVEEIRTLEVIGSSELTLSGVDNDELQLTVAGAGTCTLSGKTGELVVSLDGAAKVVATGLQATDAKITITGASTVDVCDTGILDVQISGVGTVRYTCDPATVNQNVTGLGSVEELPN